MVSRLVCWSVGRSVGLLIGWSVCWLVGQSVISYTPYATIGELLVLTL